LRQEDFGQREEAVDTDNDFLRDTDAHTNLKEFRTGFNTSPWERISLNASYRYFNNRSDYDHKKDFIGFDTNGLPIPDSGFGYSAFIRARKITTDQIETKLVYKATRWLKTSLTYKLVATDYRTTTESVPADQIVGGPAVSVPGGRVFAGNYDAHVCSVNAIVTPFARAYFSGTFSYQHARTTTQRNDDPAIAAYKGDVFSVLANATYILDDATDVYANYTFSRADFSQNNAEFGLPLGIEYDLHGLQVGLRRKFKKTAAANLQYAFYKYDEPSSGHVNDYTAHGIFASVSFRWR
jgi:hypothetical protein